MISAEELYRITSSYRVGGPKVIPIEGEDYMELDGMYYILHRKDRNFTVTGIAWGHGQLFITTKELGKTGINYEHESIELETVDDDGEEGCRQMVLEEFA